MKDNKLLAEYLGVYFDKMGTAWLGTGKGKGADFIGDWRPNPNWNQLMMVVEKIEEEAEVSEVQIFRTTCNVCDKIDNIIHLHAPSRIEAVYNACVGYIKSK